MTALVPMPSTFRSVALAAAALLVAAGGQAQQSSPVQSVPAPASERVELPPLQQVQKLMAAGQMRQALERADAHLKGNPRDAQMRFVRGVILSELKDPQAARDVFERLTEEYPELPEPYNNLAVIYAGQGQLDRALTLLETALSVRPDYATALENLGDIHLQMGADAYQRAAKLQPSSRALASKLTLTRELLAKTQALP